ncbi:MULTISPECIES: PepSY-associated TM helix domain-containing protein [unclassified Oceanicaulis]|uniref:PepSY-associated TM helix domain-containing protein n=1 Tax=unclassified Oceanicaulis TaxID=2632123 RepID=UPI0025FF2647|nr:MULTISPECIES: PepSY-associated TM helix domain-containing protein [unclassified Oceanicaulis]|tara:strand:- start:5687 stop:6835 length:1149 start_codon:yes stop_codon:yes gene_type:complete
MKIRDIIFWLHLSVGMTLGVFILLMSVTGVLLTYERQIIRMAQNSAISAPADAEPLSYQALADAAIEAGGAPGHVMTVPNGREGAVSVSAGRRNSFLLNPYTGERLEEAGEGTRAFFRRVMYIHRWLAFTGGRNEVGAQINGVSNLLFALLCLTGLYLWLPKLWRAAFLKPRLTLLARHPNAKARHFNWHHALGLWFALPLVAITLTGAVFSYRWAGDVVSWVFGGAQGQSGGQQVELVNAEPARLRGDVVSLDALVGAAQSQTGREGRRVQITLPAPDAVTTLIAIDSGNGVEPGSIHSFEIARDGGSVSPIDPRAEMPLARKARIFIRFLHTGEVFGLIGQTIAGLASAVAVLLVYTGLCLGSSRLWTLYQKRRRQRAPG